MEKNILALLQQDKKHSNQQIGSAEDNKQNKYQNEVSFSRKPYPLKQKKIDVKKTFSQKVKDRPKFYSEQVKSDTIDQSFDEEYKENISQDFLFQILENGGGNFQQFNEEELSRLIIKVLQLSQSDNNSSETIVNNLMNKTSKDLKEVEKTVRNRLSLSTKVMPKLNMATFLILWCVFRHRITSEQFMSNFTMQFTPLLTKSLNIHTSFMTLLQALYLSLVVQDVHQQDSVEGSITIKWIDTLTELFFILTHIQSQQNNQNATQKQSEGQQIVQVIDKIQIKLDQQRQTIIEAQKLIGNLELLNENKEILVDKLRVNGQSTEETKVNNGIGSDEMIKESMVL